MVTNLRSSSTRAGIISTRSHQRHDIVWPHLPSLLPNGHSLRSPQEQPQYLFRRRDSTTNQLPSDPRYHLWHCECLPLPLSLRATAPRDRTIREPTVLDARSGWVCSVCHRGVVLGYPASTVAVTVQEDACSRHYDALDEPPFR